MHEKSDSRPEIKRRIQKAAYARRKLTRFWKKCTIRRIKKIQMYESLIASKLVYGMETLVLPKGWDSKIDAAYLKGIRQILGLKTTYGQMQAGEDRTNTNQKVLEQTEQILNIKINGKRFQMISERIKDRAMKLLGRSLRKPQGDPVAEVMIGASDTWNLPMPGELRKYRPRCNWAIETAKNAWRKFQLYDGLLRARGNGRQYFVCTDRNVPEKDKHFNYKDEEHRDTLISAAKRGYF